MEALNKLLAPISPIMAGIKENRSFINMESSSKEPPNKKTSVQRRLFSTKKKHAKIKKKTLAATELDKIAVGLLHPK